MTPAMKRLRMLMTVTSRREWRQTAMWHVRFFDTSALLRCSDSFSLPVALVLWH